MVEIQGMKKLTVIGGLYSVGFINPIGVIAGVGRQRQNPVSELPCFKKTGWWIMIVIFCMHSFKCGASMFLQNIGICLKNYIMTQSGYLYSYFYTCHQLHLGKV
jgi:hypothetical protein